jgi:tRNA(fMet)-specific endonuclease VapC
MLRYLLDTDICSYAIKHKEARLLRRIREGLIAEEIAISVITRGELLYGLALLPEAASLARAVHAFLDTVPCLDWNKEAANCYAPLRASQKVNGNPIGYMDTQIAAHALAENLILVTNNERHYGRINGLQLANWSLSDFW